MKEVSFQNIAAALQRIITYEEGIRFQRLAISLASQRWPQLVASETHRDGGEDASIPFVFEGKDVSIGSSITDGYSKIREDAQKILDGKGKLDVFVFYTPHKIALASSKDNRKSQEKWKSALKKDCGCGLVLITREDIIQKLMIPENGWMCREFLGLDAPHTPDIQNIIDNVQAASNEIVNQWKGTLLADNFLIDLTIDEKSEHFTGEIGLEDIANRLSEKHRSVLSGPPGSGKTTTLIQVALKLIEQNCIPILISLPEWIDSTHESITDYIAGNPSFSSRQIGNDELLLLYRNGKLVFLLNGWNEIDQAHVKRAARTLARLDREYIAAGILIATRESSIAPPFYDGSDLTIREMSNDQRRGIIQHLITDNWEHLSNQIESNPTLSRITRTPLFLIELIKIYQDNETLPQSRVQIFERFIRRIEHSSEHSADLNSPPISDRSGYYLSQLSYHATRLGKVVITNDDACSVISAACNQLRQSGQLHTAPEPTAIIDLLCNHHLLVRSHAPAASVRFIHQQFQEYFAYCDITKRIQGILGVADGQDIAQFQEEIINYPAWEEPLNLLAEDLAVKLDCTEDEETKNIAQHLVKWTIPVDPFFAAKLINILGATIWDIVKDDFEPILRKWYECPDENHKACALAAMLATGTDTFSDIIWSLLEHENNQIRLRTYCTAKPFSINSLGNNWQDTVNSWDEDRRSEFLRGLSFDGDSSVVDVFEFYARNDPSTKVKAEAIRAIAWCGARSRLHDIIPTCDDETFRTLLRDDNILDEFSDSIIARAIECYSQILKDIDTPRERLRLLKGMYKLCKSDAITLLKRELQDYQPERSDTLLNDLLKIVASKDPDWVNQWVCQQIIRGHLYYDYYSDYITNVPEAMIGELLSDFVETEYSEQLANHTKELIAIGATLDHVHHIIQQIARLSSQFKQSPSSISDPDRNLYHRLVDVARLVPLHILVAVILQKHQNPRGTDLKVVLDLLGTYRLQVSEESSLNLQEQAQRDLRGLLCGYSNLVLKADDFSGVLKADLSCAMALFGQPEDIAVIKELIVRDVQRVRNGLKARKEGIRNNPQTNGCCTSWAGWHVRAILEVDSDEAEDVLIQLLNEPEYENDAGNGLVQLLWKDIPKETMGFGISQTLIIGSHSWREQYINPEKRSRYAKAIVERLNTRRKQNKDDCPKKLAGHLAKLNDPDTIPLILEIIEMPRPFDAWDRVYPLEMLVRNGHILDTATALKVLDPAIEQAVDRRQSSSGNQDMDLLVRCLCILLCSDDVAMAIHTIDQILQKNQLWHELRPLIETLGNRSTRETAQYLIHLCNQERFYGSLGYELIRALGRMEVSVAKQALLSAIDNSITSHNIPMPGRSARSTLIQVLSKCCNEDNSIQERITSLLKDDKLSGEQRETIFSIINACPSNSAIVNAILSLPQGEDSIPYELMNAVERSVVRHVPTDEDASWCNILPQSNNELGHSLFSIVANKQDNYLFAFRLLGYVNWLRIEYGRPKLEPRHPDSAAGKHWSTLCDLK